MPGHRDDRREWSASRAEAIRVFPALTHPQSTTVEPAPDDPIARSEPPPTGDPPRRGDISVRADKPGQKVQRVASKELRTGDNKVLKP